jgi:cytochrome c-type biogenesis protein CcsB
MLSHLFNAALVAYVLAMLLAVVRLFVPRRALDVTATALMTLGGVALTVYMGVRWAQAGRAPFSNMFESIVLFGWTIPWVSLLLRWRLQSPPALTAATALLAVLLLVYASAFLSSEIRPLMPALRSNWLTFHVLTCLISYGAFAVAFLAAVLFLVVSRPASKMDAGDRELFATIMCRTVSFGFLFIVLGIATGAVWANVAWGTYWSWDPKETWSLITALIYAMFLHCRYMRGWQERRLAWVAILGFISVLVTYLGVNFLMKGLHSYAT